MAIEFKGSNAVILPPPNPNQLFNPAIFSQIWMIQHLRVEPNDFINEGAVQTPFLFHQPTRAFVLLVVQERIQLNFATLLEDAGDIVRRVVPEVLGQSPCYSAGFNFNWLINWNNHQNSETSRRIFFTGNNPLFRLFDTQDACFGAYASKDYLGMRFRVDAKPVIIGRSEEVTTSGVLFNFNFHQELTGDDRLEDIRYLLRLWEQTRDEAARIIQQINGECDL